MPTDVVAAEQDGVAVPQHMAQIADAIPHASYHLLAGALNLEHQLAGVLAFEQR